MVQDIHHLQRSFRECSTSSSVYPCPTWVLGNFLMIETVNHTGREKTNSDFHNLGKILFIFFHIGSLSRFTRYGVSHLSYQKPTESCMPVGSPNMCICSQAYVDMVSLLQMEENCISSIIISFWWVVMCHDHEVLVLVEIQHCPMSSVVEDGKVINACNRCNEDTCGNNRVLKTEKCELEHVLIDDKICTVLTLLSVVLCAWPEPQPV